MSFLNRHNYKQLVFYKKALCLYDITYSFTNRYLTQDKRTTDQMIQAARSGKQNIIEGTEAGMTSAETELKLLNVARASLLELLADYEDYLRVRQLSIWGNTHPRYANLHHFCCTHTELADYTTLLHRMEGEEIANMAITLIHQADSGLIKFIHWQEQQFLDKGGIRENMSKARREQRGY